MFLFHDTQIKIENKNYTFQRPDSKHISKVLRKEIGTLITITDGKGLEWKGEITLLTPQRVYAEKIEALKHSRSKKLIHLAIAPTKSNDRMEWLMEKLTELGIASITPLLCERSERKVTKTERLIKIAVTALKQSHQFFLPEIRPMTSFKEYLKTLQHQTLIAHCDNTPKKNLSEHIIQANEISLCIGPEGDFSPSEIKLATLAGIIPVSLGEQRFRTETAGLLGCHSIFLQNQKK